MDNRIAVIVGAGPGISGSFGEALVADGYKVALASRSLVKLNPIAAAMGAMAFEVDGPAGIHVVHFIIDGTCCGCAARMASQYFDR